MIGELAALGAAIAWTFSSVFYRKGLAVANPFQGNVIRFTCVSIVLVVLSAFLGKITIITALPTSVNLIIVLSATIGLVLGDTLYMFAIRALGVARAVPICFTYPLFNVLIAVLIKGEQLTLLIAVGAVSIVLGTWLVCKKSNSNDLKVENLRRGYITALGAAIIWAIGIALLNFAVSSPSVIGFDGILTVTFLRLLSAWAILLALCPIMDPKLGFMRISWKTWLLMGSGGIVALGVGGFLLASSFQFIESVRAVPLSSTTPFFSVVAGVLVLHERITHEIMLGAIIIVFGTILLILY